MRIGSARDSEIPLSGEGIGAVHGYLHIDVENVIYEPILGQVSYINEKSVSKKTPFKVTDTLRIGSHEFSLSDPQAAKKQAPSSVSSAIKKKPAVPENDTQSTVFREVAIPEASGWMIQGLHPSLKNKRFPIDDIAVIGRSNECELSFANDRLSRKHAQFRLLDGILFLKDLDSSNGVFHNGEKVSQAKLANGDTIAFDKLEFTVIAPKAQNDELVGGTVDNSNATVVRAAITPEAMQQAQKASVKPVNKVAEPVPEIPSSNNNTLMIIGVIITVALIAIAAIIM